MNKTKKILSKQVLIVVLTVLIASFALPLLSSLIGISKVHRIIYLFFVVNPLITILISWLIRHFKMSVLWLFFFPIVFAVSVWWRFAKYNYWLAGIYLILGLIFYLLMADKTGKTKQHN